MSAIRPRSSDVAAVAADVDRFGFELVAGLAGLVLEGRPVAIVAGAAALPGPEDRANLVDAVWGLLPLGCRARLGAHQEPLVFADLAADGQARVTWAEPPPRPRTADAAEYVKDLVRLRRGDAKFRTADIVGHLRGEADPGQSSDAVSARRGLLSMDLVREVARLIRSGRGTAADAQQVLAKHPLGSLPSQHAQTLVQFLADRVLEDQAAGELLVRTWSAETERRLGAYGRTLLTEADQPRLRSWFVLADRAGPAAGLGLLRELLRPTESMRDLRPAAADAVLQLLSGVKGAIKDPVVQRLIADQPTVCVALLRMILHRGIPAERAVGEIERWLLDPAAGSRPWLAPFGFAIGRGEPNAEQWRALADIDDRVWPVLLHIAAFTKRPIFASMWPFLVDRAGLIGTDAENLAIDAALDALTPENCGLADIEWVRIDLLHLVRFAQMPGLIIGSVPLPDYAGALRSLWPSPVLARHRMELGRRLVGAIFPEPGTVVQAQRLMAIVPADDQEVMDLAARAIAQQVDARPSDFVDLVFGADWIERIRRVSALGRFWAYQGLRTLTRRGAGIEQVAAGFAQATDAGLSFEDLERLAAEWFHINSAQSIIYLLTELWRHGRADYAEILRKRISSGTYGQRLADRWNVHVGDGFVFMQWLAGRTRPPRYAPPAQREPVAPGGADPGAAPRSEPVSKIIKGMLRSSRSAGGGERPAADER
ncbi:hypothetical protein [Dactylosporangium sp. NPDC051541]|uniref:hypothetical protein n=1 Tax=Dactylosporangium sp. NPDC051541 TaxID=3363977 RepID=UPI00379D5D64